MKTRIIGQTPNPAWTCEVAAATCVAGRPSERALKIALASGHESVAEHASYTFSVEHVSRVLLAQLTRHRIASYSVKSQRYVRLKDEELIIPESIRGSELYDEVMGLMSQVMDMYQRLVDAGVPCEDARYITPEAVPTDIVATMNARELRHFFSLRCCNRAQWEIRQLADAMLLLCRETAPALFEDAGPGCVTDRCREARPCGHPRLGNGLFE